MSSVIDTGLLVPNSVERLGPSVIANATRLDPSPYAAEAAILVKRPGQTPVIRQPSVISNARRVLVVVKFLLRQLGTSVGKWDQLVCFLWATFHGYNAAAVGLQEFNTKNVQVRNLVDLEAELAKYITAQFDRLKW